MSPAEHGTLYARTCSVVGKGAVQHDAGVLEVAEIDGARILAGGVVVEGAAFYFGDVRPAEGAIKVSQRARHTADSRI